MKSALVAAMAALSLATVAGAQTSTGQATEGEVRKVDRQQGKITLRHGPIANLEMSAMTMIFRVADAKLLDGLKEGDKVRFSADRIDGMYTVTSISPVK